MDAEHLRILLVDDERSLRQPLAKFLTLTHGFEVRTAVDGLHALALAAEVGGEFDVALIDRLLVSESGAEELDGIELMRQLRLLYPGLECIIFTGWGTEERQRALEQGAFRYLEKPFDNDELAMHIRVAAQQVRLRAISHDILSNLELNQVLPRIAAAARSLSQSDVAHIALVHEASGELQPHQFDSLLEGQIRWEQFVAETGLDTLVRQGTGRSVANLAQTPWATPGLLELGFLSYVGVPIRGDGGGLGALLALSREAGHFDAWGHTALLQTLASQAALAIANARSYQEKKSRAGHMEALVKVGQALTRTTDLSEQLQLAWEFIEGQLQADTFVVALYDRAQDLVEFPFARDQGQPKALPPLPLGQALRPSVTEYVIRNGQERYWSSSEQRRRECDRLGLESIRNGRDCESCFYFPLAAGAEVIGALSLQAYVRHAFEPVLLDACRALGNQLAVAIANSRLLGSTRRQATDLGALLRLSVDVASSLDLRHVMRRACEAAVEIFRAEHSGLVYFDANGEGGAVQAEFPPGLTPPGTRIPVRGVAAEERVLRGETLSIDRVADWPELGPVRDQMLGQYDIQSTLITPIKVSVKERDRKIEKVVGSFSIDAVGHTRCFSREDERLSQLLATQVAVAVENAQLYEEARQRSDLLAALEQASRNIRAIREPAQLLSETVRQAVQLLHCSVGCLFINDPYRSELTLTTAYGLENVSLQARVEHGTGLLGKVMESRRPEPCTDYADSPYVDPLFAGCRFRSALATPVLSTDGVDAILFLAMSRQRHVWTNLDLDIITRFAEQAAIALQASRAITAEQRTLDQQQMLHALSDYMQAANDRDKILRVILAGVTAGWSLGFNRAGLLLLNEAGDALVGEMGVGHVDEVLQRLDWERDVAAGVNRFDAFRERLEAGELDVTPIHERVRSLTLPLGRDDVFARVLRQGRYERVYEDDQAHLPQAFIDQFEPASPLIVAPLVARNVAIGLLVADNRFTRLPITDAVGHSLMTLANTAAVAIANKRDYDEALSSTNWLRSYFAASHMQVTDVSQSLEQIVRRAQDATRADAVGLALMDKRGRPREWVAHGPQPPADFRQMVRADGLSMKIFRSGRPLPISDTLATAHAISRSEFWSHFRAALGMPVTLEGDTVGVMWFLFAAPRPFTQAEIVAVQLFVNQAAIAYDSARRIKELDQMRQAAMALAGQSSPPEVLQTIAEGARLVLGAESIVIWSYDRSRRRFVPRKLTVAGNIPGDELALFRRMEPVLGQTMTAGAHHGYVAIEDLDGVGGEHIDLPTRQLLTRLGIGSVQAVALRAGDEPLGVLHANYVEPRAFDEDDKQSILTFARQASIALHRARGQEQLRRTHKAAAGVAEAIVQQELDRTLNAIAASTRQALQADVVNVYAYDEQVGRLTTMGQDFAQRRRPAARPPAYVRPDSVIHTILQLDRPPYWLTTDTESARQQLLRGVFVQRESIRASAGILLHNRDHMCGVMFVSYVADHTFTPDEMRTIQLFAGIATAAVINHQRFEELDKARRMLDARTRVAAMSLIAGDYFHRVATDAEVIVKWVEQAEDVLGHSAIDEHLTGIHHTARDILDLPVNIPLSQTEAVERLAVDHFFGHTWDTLAHKEQYRRLRFDFDPLLVADIAVRANPVWLGRVVELLVQNSARAMERTPTKRLRLSLSQDGAFVSVRLRDTGCGVPEDQLPLIFRQPTPKTPAAPGQRLGGLGFGCLFAQLIVQTYGGDIDVEPMDAPGTTVVFRLPTAA